MNPDDEAKIKCEVAYKVMRKKFPQFYHVLVTDDIPNYLYSEDLIEEESMQKYAIRELTKDEKARIFYQDIHRRVRLDHTVFEKMLEIIKKHGVKQEKLVQSLEGNNKSNICDCI